MNLVVLSSSVILCAAEKDTHKKKTGEQETDRVRMRERRGSRARDEDRDCRE